MILTGKKDEEDDGKSCNPSLCLGTSLTPAWSHPSPRQGNRKGRYRDLNSSGLELLAPVDPTMSEGQHGAGWAHSSSCCCHGNASLCLSLALPKTSRTQWTARPPWAGCLGALSTVLHRTAKAGWAEMKGGTARMQRQEEKIPILLSSAFPFFWSVMHSHNSKIQADKHLWNQEEPQCNMPEISSGPSHCTWSPITAGPLELSPVNQVILAPPMQPGAEASQDLWDDKRLQRRTLFASVQEGERFGRKQRT